MEHAAMCLRVLSKTSRLSLCLLILLLAGCGGSGLSGSVSYNGQPVKKGYISFDPVDGKSPTAGGEITNGAYSVKKIGPGKYKVRVQAQSDVIAPNDRGAAQAVPPGSGNVVPENAEGNGREMEVKPGEPLDIKLLPPAGGKAP